MTLDPRIAHQLEQLAAAARDAAREVNAYYRRLVDEEGMPEERAWELAVRLEERLLGPIVHPRDGDDDA